MSYFQVLFVNLQISHWQEAFLQTIHQLFNMKAKLKDMRVYDLPGEENGK